MITNQDFIQILHVFILEVFPSHLLSHDINIWFHYTQQS